MCFINVGLCISVLLEWLFIKVLFICLLEIVIDKGSVFFVSVFDRVMIFGMIFVFLYVNIDFVWLKLVMILLKIKSVLNLFVVLWMNWRVFFVWNLRLFVFCVSGFMIMVVIFLWCMCKNLWNWVCVVFVVGNGIRCCLMSVFLKIWCIFLFML